MYEGKSMEKRAGKDQKKGSVPQKNAQNKEKGRRSRETYEEMIDDIAMQMRIYGASYEDSRDIAHESFLRTYGKHIKGKTNVFKIYMFTTAKNLLFRQSKRSNMFVEYEDEYDLLQINRNDPLTEFLKKEQSVLLLEAISMLPEEDRKIIEMDMMNIEHKKIGNKLNLSHSTVRTRKHRILQCLKDYFERTPENVTLDKIERNMRTISRWLKRGDLTRYMYNKILNSLERKKLILQTIKKI